MVFKNICENGFVVFCLVGHAVDLGLATHHHRRLDAGAGRRMSAEIVLVDLIEAPEIPGIVEPGTHADNMLRAAIRFLENGQEIADRLVGLRDLPPAPTCSVPYRFMLISIPLTMIPVDSRPALGKPHA